MGTTIEMTKRLWSLPLDELKGWLQQWDENLYQYKWEWAMSIYQVRLLEETLVACNKKE